MMSATMRGYVDIHCHWLPGVDDGAESLDDSIALLERLRAAGFDQVVATPHMRAGMFDNSREDLERVFAEVAPIIRGRASLPAIELSCEHHLDDVVFHRLLRGGGLPYPAGKTVLIELPYDRFPVRLSERLFELRCQRLRPVLAHPERYRPVWKDLSILDPLLDGGTVLLLDVGALSGKYGRATRRCAEALLEAGYLYAACSDAHRTTDVDAVERGIERLVALAGEDEASFLLRDGPTNILAGTVED
jgi:protein-tyrosine phosphatase